MRFLPDCTGQTNCIQSTAPIQAAVNYFAAHSAEIATPDRTIFVEGGTFKEDVTINGLSNLALLGSANGSTTILDGLFTIVNSIGVNLSQFTVNKGVVVNTSRNVTLDKVTTSAGVQVADSRNVTVQNSSVSNPAPALGISIARSDTVTIANVATDSVRADDSRDVAVSGTDNADHLSVILNSVERARIDGGSGDDALTFAGTNVTGAVDVLGGAGADSLTITSLPAGATFSISSVESVTTSAGAITDALSTGLQTLADRVGVLDDSGALATKLPVAGVTYNQMLDM